MDRRLFNAACAGDQDALHQLLAENPFVLEDCSLITLHENPINVATKANQVRFVQEIIKLKPELAKETSQDGVRSLDIASAYGYVEIVRTLLEGSEPSICRLPGRDGRTAIHYAAINGRIEVIDQLLSVCSDAIEDITAFGETALHLAVKYFKYEASRCLMEWLEKLGKRNLVNLKDKEGNTILHYAVSRKQLEMVELMVNKNSNTRDIMEVNALNKNGLTAMDALDILIESSNDVQMMRRILQNAGGQGTPEVRVSKIQSSEAIGDNGEQSEGALVLDNKKDGIWSWMYKKGRDDPSVAQNLLLVIATLVVTVTFQAGINPPTYIFQDMDHTNYNITWNREISWNQSSRVSVDLKSNSDRHNAIYLLIGFLAPNTIALTAAMNIIDSVRAGLPFQWELRVSGFFLYFAYSFAVAAVRPTNLIKDVVILAAGCTPFLIRILQVLSCAS